MKKTHILLSCCALSMAFSSLAADAAMIFTFQRLSDTEATMTASGLVGLGFPSGDNVGAFGDLELRGVMNPAGFGPATGAVEQFAGDFELANAELQGWTVLEGDMILFPNIFFGDRDSPSGISHQRVLGGNIQWGAIGATGDVWATYRGQNSQTFPLNGDYLIGSWEIVAAPVPDSGSSLALFGSAFAFLVATGALPSIRRVRATGSRRRGA